VQERLEREYDLDLIVTAPAVKYKIKRGENGVEEDIDSPSKMPDTADRELKTMEPYVHVEVLTPSEYNGPIIELGQERRGILLDIKFLSPTRSTIVYEIPLAEVITDFFDVLKSRTRGYASMEYRLIDYRESDLVRLDVKINYEDAAPLATIVHRDSAQGIGRALTKSLKELIPRQMFKIPIQACVGVKVIASTSISVCSAHSIFRPFPLCMFGEEVGRFRNREGLSRFQIFVKSIEKILIYHHRRLRHDYITTSLLLCILC